ncbi:MAG: virulence RhuM family protein [Sulfuricurvum sp.]|uniref:virulence RhuM family protein n=1 Tax=Sulfuricurvum sp. TaxID=2025608 RepID=UPI002610CFAF|nr:virulence RhuM family protein [Sulfuricurvum sp.]MDD2828776.1 virulence RhuM family protein [Sulfuricurvum sp.]MDD4948765.1 virulence RhuM family protein [Sulfuricurvum sp.]
MEEESNIIIYNTADGKASVSLLTKDGTAWLNQNQLAELFVTSKQNISLHIINIFEEGELDANSVVKDYLTTAADGKNYSVSHYSLEMILAIGFRVRSKRGTQFRQWAGKNLSEYMIKGFVMDDERLKNPDGKPDYFDELLARIRDIRASEKRFYQKVRDLFMISRDYDASDKATQLFYADAQNKLLFAITGQTAAEIIVNRANASEANMALTSFKGSIVRKQDIYTAKNYLTEDEIDSLNRFVVVFLETAELRAKNRQDVTMDFWRENIDRIIEFNDKEVLQGYGSIGHEQMKKMVEKVYETFNAKRKAIEAIEADEQDLAELKQIEEKVKSR